MKKKPVELIDSSVFNYRRLQKRFNRIYFLKIYALKYLPIIFSFFFLNFLWVIFDFFWWLIVTVFFDHRDFVGFSPVIRVWFGVPGSGKTTMGAWLTRYSRKQKINVLSNVDIKGTYRLDPDDLGTYDMSFNGHGCHVVYDEGSIDFDNRNHSRFAQSNKPKYFALHRHMNNQVDVFSQGYDIDKRIRDRTSSSGLFQLRRSFISGFIIVRKIKKVLFIKKDDKQMIDGFEYKGLPRVVYARNVWHSFDTCDLSLCPKEKKEWILRE